MTSLRKSSADVCVHGADVRVHGTDQPITAHHPLPLWERLPLLSVWIPPAGSSRGVWVEVDIGVPARVEVGIGVPARVEVGIGGPARVEVDIGVPVSVEEAIGVPTRVEVDMGVMEVEVM